MFSFNRIWCCPQGRGRSTQWAIRAGDRAQILTVTGWRGIQPYENMVSCFKYEGYTFPPQWSSSLLLPRVAINSLCSVGVCQSPSLGKNKRDVTLFVSTCRTSWELVAWLVCYTSACHLRRRQTSWVWPYRSSALSFRSTHTQSLTFKRQHTPSTSPIQLREQ